MVAITSNNCVGVLYARFNVQADHRGTGRQLLFGLLHYQTVAGAMNFNLEDLFQQIIDSEQQVHSRLALVAEVRKENAACLTEISHAETERMSYNGQLDIETRRLVEAALCEGWASGRLGVFQQQRDELAAKRDRVQADTEAARVQVVESRRRFDADIEQFVTRYDLNASQSQQQQRETDMKAEIKRLQTDVEKLEAELATLRQQQKQQQQQHMSTVATANTTTTTTTTTKQQRLEQLRRQCDAEIESTWRLDVEKLRVAQIPHTDPEYTRLAAELESTRNDTAANEQRFTALRQQLQQLQSLQQLSSHRQQDRRQFR